MASSEPSIRLSQSDVPINPWPVVGLLPAFVSKFMLGDQRIINPSYDFRHEAMPIASA
jgi:hypothetical protein